MLSPTFGNHLYCVCLYCRDAVLYLFTYKIVPVIFTEVCWGGGLAGELVGFFLFLNKNNKIKEMWKKL